MAIRVMLDTDNLNDLDGHAELLATYADLITSHAQLEELKARFPDSELIFIDRNLGDPLDIATIADVEPRAMTVDQLPGWAARKQQAGQRYLTGYCDRNDLPAVEAIIRHGLYHGVATLDGDCMIAGFRPLHGPAFVQILGEHAIGIHGDLSLVLEDGWHPRAGYAAEATTPAETPGNLQAAWSETVQDLSAKAPSWLFKEQDGSYLALQSGTRTELSADTVASLEARIRQLYPDTIS